MKNMLISCVCLFVVLQIGEAIAQQKDPYPRRLSTGNNFIQTITPTIPVMDTVGLVLATSSETIDYFDGLGRLERTVVRGGGSDYSDLVSLHEYDPYGRTAEKWLTSIGELGTGSCMHFSSIKSNAVNSRLYNDQYPCVNTKFEASPLNRPVERYGAGSVWRTAKKCEKFQYLTNDDSPELKCVRYQVTGERKDPVLQIVGQYTPGSLVVTRTTTEDGTISSEFKNIAGQTILSRVQYESLYQDTYFVYDNFGNLCFVLSPNTSAVMDRAIDREELNRTGYQYRYDEKNRCIAKKLPGADWVYSQYDADDKLIYWQDGNLRQQNVNLWAFVLYDILGREVMTGYVRIDVAGLQIETKHYVACRSNVDGLYGYLLPVDLPADSLEVTSVSYYDDYLCYDGPYSDKMAYVQDNEYDSRDDGILRSKGLKTGMLRFISKTEVPLYSTFYYDSRGRLVQLRSTNHAGGMSNVYNKYDFVGKLLRSKEEHSTSADGSKLDWLEQHFYYNHAGLPDSTCYLLNGLYSMTVRNTYDRINRLASTGYGVNGNLIVDSRRYNVRSWLTEKSITTAGGERKFAMSLYYQNPRYSSTIPSYTGNITEWSWRHGDDDAPQTYAFTYDNLSRLTNTKQYIADIADDRFVERGMSYDRNGNLLSLQRTALGNATDDFTYSYTGNKPVAIGGTTVGFYSYDANGNMTHDGPNNLDLTYDAQNLIKKATREGTTLAEYVYLSDGTKLSALDAMGDGLVYLGSLVYRKSGSALALESVPFDGGRFVATVSGVEPLFHITDHLGSVRAIVDASGNVSERNDYYPYGMRWDNPESLISDNRHRYNGKEEQAFINLPYTDYGARQRDPKFQPGNWNGVDPLTEKMPRVSPFTFCNGNPVRFVDLDGREVWIHHQDENGEAQKTRYSAMMKYEGSNNFIASTVNYLNNVFSYGGAMALKLLIGSTNAFNVTSDMAPVVGTLSFRENTDGGGTFKLGAIMTSGFEKSQGIESVAHEVFHGVQHEKGQGGTSIFNEVEAYVFGAGVMKNWMNAPNSDFLGGPHSLAGAGQENANGIIYENSFKLLSSQFSKEAFCSAVNNFKSGAYKNSTGLYNNYPLIRPNQTKFLLPQFYYR